MSDEFEQLLERIRQREHPEYGSITWDGHRRSFEVSVQFARSGVAEDEGVIRARALRYLGSLSKREREAARIDIQLRCGVPVRAVLRGNTGDLDPERLRELERRAFGV